ncbi:hypothetical protein GALL_544440 [mine drainage metagenome]|uniref:Uncharacterized protein n=1 Tax=mine drainage metagenome TaxID=410659 RepID=A0A1J5NXM6_9ZZZZ
MAPAVLAPLYRDAVAFDGEIVGEQAELLTRKQFKRGLRAVIGVALILAFLDGVKDAGEARITGCDLDPRGLQAGAQVGLAGLIGHRDDAGIADFCRVDVFVGGGVFQDRRGVQPRLVRESRGTDIGREPQWHAV